MGCSNNNNSHLLCLVRTYGRQYHNKSVKCHILEKRMRIVSYLSPATAIPSITSEFNTLNDVGWYGSAYLFSGCAMQPTYGKIYTYFHVKWTYLSALLLFEVGSVICATASSSVVFIIGRAVAGFGSAGLRSGASTIIAISVPIHKRGLFNSSLASTFGSKIFSYWYQRTLVHGNKQESQSISNLSTTQLLQSPARC